MPVHIPGPRLYHSIKFKHLAQKGHGGGGGGGNVNMNLTPFVDMMTILVTFLLMVFSSSGEILTAQAGMEMPTAVQQAELQQAPVVTVTMQSITFDNVHMTETESVADPASGQWKISELYDAMQQERQNFKLNFDKLPDADRARCTNPQPEDPIKCLDGLAILQADKRVTANVINSVLKTANAAGYTNIMFAVERRGRRAGE
ncbi:ExbD/TolR family protein [Haliangium ochraceum]|uniref:Biopolymer transport protein ExbD/TolR n=1 Tax=Haliangium ochraceum (strain DSM 14365 / JCM 11303 / SMP-2) TaxID=502025 RepID=D0LY00_HALO1|nr:biopolymer transporter ExbD [Haliangium ochraceum]ACY14355.1 Biopolymer transport protein ExbD/TolR [Haliangium ochraceum DSM 14365]